MLGWPVRRRRMFSAGINKATMAWLGPDNAEDLLSDFLAFFQAELQTDGGVFLVASLEERRAEEMKMARARGHGFVSELDKLDKHQMLAPGQLLRLEEYSKMYSDSDGQKVKHYFADLDQNPAGGASTAGEMIPSLLTHGAVYDLKADRIVLAEELYLSHGYNVCQVEKKSSSARSCRIKDFLKKLPTVQRLHLLGNGWHLPVVSAWFLYILSHCVRLNRTMTVQPERSLLRKGGSRLCESPEEPQKRQKHAN